MDSSIAHVHRRQALQREDREERGREGHWSGECSRAARENARIPRGEWNSGSGKFLNNTFENNNSDVGVEFLHYLVRRLSAASPEWPELPKSFKPLTPSPNPPKPTQIAHSTTPSPSSSPPTYPAAPASLSASPASASLPASITAYTNGCYNAIAAVGLRSQSALNNCLNRSLNNKASSSTSSNISPNNQCSNRA